MAKYRCNAPPRLVPKATGRRLLRVTSRNAAAVAFGVGLTGCSSGILDPRGPIGAAERTILLNSLTIMLAIVVPTIVATVAFAWWFRESNHRARFLPEWAYSGRIELVVWSIPTLVIMFLGGITWIGSHELDPMKPLNGTKKPVEIQVVSLDWKWLFIYPDQGIASVNQLVVPVATPVHFSLTSASVMNAFFVPQLGGMIYVMNGMKTQLSLQADQEGDFYGRSAHFSGDGFPGMEFTLRAVSDDAFSKWVSTVRSQGVSLDKSSYHALAKQTINVPPSTYRSVAPGLFHAIVTQAIPPAAGPSQTQPEARVSPKTGG